MSDHPESSAKTRAKPKIYERQEFIPVLIFVFLFFLLIINTSISGYPPNIERITRENNIHTYTIKIDGKNFGQVKSGSEVFIDDLALTDSAFLKWSDSQIVIAIPKEIKSGLLYVVTKSGKTNSVIYTNPQETPKLISAMYTGERSVQQNRPSIKSITPMVCKVGDILTIRGNGFGKERDKSRIYFTWISETKNPETPEETTTTVSAKENDFDYLEWNDKEIHVRVPDGAESGNVFIKSERGLSNAKYIEIQHPYGIKHYYNRNKYSVKYSITIKDVSAEPGNGIYLWVPKIGEEPEQRDISYIRNDNQPQPILDDYKGVMLICLEELANNNQYEINLECIFDRYAVRTEINTDLVPQEYDTADELFKHYTGENEYIKPEQPAVKELSAAVTGREKNPYLKAKKIYEYIIDTFSFTYVNPYKYDNWLSALDTKKGDSFIYAMLFCTLSRSAGIPARPIAGYIIDENKRSIRHFWAEFYLPDMGWIPVDPFLGDTRNDPAGADAYFGGLDNHHITLSKGYIELKKMTPGGRTVKKAGLANLQSIHEEVKGNLFGYSISWQDIKILGIF
jgi:hypothetical protein